VPRPAQEIIGRERRERVRNWLGAAQGALIRAAALTQTLGRVAFGFDDTA